MTHDEHPLGGGRGVDPTPGGEPLYVDDGFANVIPLTSADKVAPLEERQDEMREAVLQVVSDLVIRRVPPNERLPLFDVASNLLDKAERSLPELVEAAEPGPEQDALMRDLGLDEAAEETKGDG